MKRRWLSCCAGPFLALVVVAVSPPARAWRIENGDHPIELDFTEDAETDYRFAHGNGIIAPSSDPNYDPTSDNYFDWINRFEIQVTTGPWHADLRFDSALFANTPQVANISNAEGSRLSFLLQNRYVDNFQLEKISASYLGQNLQATLGDFYLSYGRGLVLSLRKIDALGVDTTLRGATVTGHAGGFSANLSGGITNVVNTDPSLGAVAPDPEDPVLAARLEYRYRQLIAVGVDGAVIWQNPNTLAYTRFQPGQVPQSVPISPLGFGSVDVLPTGSLPNQPIAGRTENYSATVEIPSLWGHGSAYAEFAHQFQYNSNIEVQGNSLYAGANGYFGDLTGQLEFKDYTRFNFPTFSSLSSTAFPAFYQQDVYTNPPNLEQIFQEESLTTRIYGPRLRLDYQMGEHLKPYGSMAFFRDDDNGYDIYDASLGFEATWQEHRSHLTLSGGYRREVYNDQYSDPGLIHATEFWFQGDVVQVLRRGYSLEFEGLHRTHRDYGFSTNYHLWHQGFDYLSLRRSRWSASVGAEYYTYSESIYQPWYLNASGSYTLTQDLLLRGFLGGRAAGLKCINGVCRNFPGYNGATVEVVAKF